MAASVPAEARAAGLLGGNAPRLRLLTRQPCRQSGLTGSINLEVGGPRPKTAAMKAHYTTFANYNAWANRRLYDAAAALSDAEYRADKGAFFKSMHGTLNHLLATDPSGCAASLARARRPSGSTPSCTSASMPCGRRARPEDRRQIVAWIGGLDEARLAGTIRYRRVSTPDEFVQPLMPALDHWFNHQTHHRGQAHMILTTLGKKAPELDLLYFQRLEDAAKAGAQ
jgi:uncharacterized damage-inducible protein DinB